MNDPFIKAILKEARFMNPFPTASFHAFKICGRDLKWQEVVDIAEANGVDFDKLRKQLTAHRKKIEEFGHFYNILSSN